MITPIEIHKQEVDKLFAYASGREKANVDKYETDPWLENIANQIKQGKWQEFLSTYRTQNNAHYLLLAAFKFSVNPILTTKELVTAFHFLHVARDDPGFEVYQLPNDDGNRARNYPDNLKVGIKTNKNIFPKPTQSSFEHFTVVYYPGVRQILKADLTHFEFFSFAELEFQLAAAPSNCIKPVLGFSPRRAYWEDVKQGITDVALLTPDMCQHTMFTHGVPTGEKGGAYFSLVHDYAHFAINVQKHSSLTPLKISLVDALLDFLDELDKDNPLPDQIHEDNYIAMLPPGVDQKTLAHKLIEELTNLLISNEERSEFFLDQHSNREDISERIQILLSFIVTRLLKLQEKSMRHLEENTTSHHESKERNTIALFTEQEYHDAQKLAEAMLKPMVDASWKPKETLMRRLGFK